MGNKEAYLALYLDAPLQSWGYQSRFDRRTTLSYPTRSGIIGMICAALGSDRGESEALERFETLSITVYSLQEKGRLTDYHTVGGGYDPKGSGRWNIPRAAGGKHRKDAVVTFREYLQWSKFGVVLAGSAVFLGEIAKALQNPKWGVWLGRKACIPAAPIYQGKFDSEDAAQARLRKVSGCEEIGRIVRETMDFAEGTDTLMDRPLDFKKREFAPRRVRVE